MNKRTVMAEHIIHTYDPVSVKELVLDFTTFFADAKTVERHFFRNPDDVVVEYRTPNRKYSWAVSISKMSSAKVLEEAEKKINVFLFSQKLKRGYKPNDEDFAKLVVNFRED